MPKAPLTVLLASPRGFCAGVDRAIQIVEAALEHGVLIRPLGDVVVLMPPLSITEDELDLLTGVVGRCIDDVTRKLR